MTVDFKRIQSATFFATLIGITLIFLWMIQPYIYPVFWAAVLAGIFQPLYKKFRTVVKKPGIAAGLTEIVILLIFIVPLAGIVALIIQQAITVYEQFGNHATYTAISDSIQNLLAHPWVQRYAGDIDISERLSTLSSAISGFVYSLLARGGQNTARWVIQFFIMLYTLYFFLKDGPVFLKKLMHLLPLGDAYEERLYERFVSTSRATLKGTLLIGLVQGSIGGIALLVTGVPGALFWAVIMILCCIIPGVGATLVLVPTAIIFALTGNWWQAIVVLISLLIASTIDNVMRGPLVGKDIQMHPLFIFFATLGGLLAFGISGVVIGPIITAFLLSIWEMYEQKYHQDLVKSG
jgi:predicted PurR-regulated permease PerM